MLQQQQSHHLLQCVLLCLLLLLLLLSVCCCNAQSSSSSSSSSTGTTSDSYVWDNTLYGNCSVECGSGLQFSQPQCVSALNGSAVNVSLCAPTPPPPILPRLCNTQACTYKWRADHHCGSAYLASDGSGYGATCEYASVEYGCCSVDGMCGGGSDYCECVGCVDYRTNINGTLVTAPADSSSSSNSDHTSLIIGLVVALTPVITAALVLILIAARRRVSRNKYAIRAQSNSSVEEASEADDRTQRRVRVHAFIDPPSASSFSSSSAAAATTSTSASSSSSPSAPSRQARRKVMVAPAVYLAPSSAARPATPAPSASAATPAAAAAASSSLQSAAVHSPRDSEPALSAREIELQSARDATVAPSPRPHEQPLSAREVELLSPRPQQQQQADEQQRHRVLTIMPVHVSASEPICEPPSSPLSMLKKPLPLCAARTPLSPAAAAAVRAPPSPSASSLSAAVASVTVTATSSSASPPRSFPSIPVSPSPSPPSVASTSTPPRSSYNSTCSSSGSSGSSNDSVSNSDDPWGRGYPHFSPSPPVLTPARLRQPLHPHRHRLSPLSPTALSPRAEESTHCCDQQALSVSIYDSSVSSDALAAGTFPSAPGSTCTICLTAAVDAFCVPCGHAHFCYACIQRWATQAHPCPICRSPIQGVARTATAASTHDDATAIT